MLKSGNYQLSVYSQEPLRVQPFNITRIMKLVELPAASALVRIRLAPLSDDLKNVFSIEDVRHLKRKDWEEKGIWPRMPLYSEGVYNNSMNIIGVADKKLFKYRNERKAINMMETLEYLLKTNAVNKQLVAYFLIPLVQKGDLPMV